MKHELTAREREVLSLIHQGCTNIEIAQLLMVSPLTIKNHVQRILKFMNASSRGELSWLEIQRLTFELDAAKKKLLERRP